MDSDFCFPTDNFFEAEPVKEPPSNAGYMPRICEPNWFLNTDEIHEDQSVTRIKSRAQWLYLNKNPKLSLELLEEIVSKVPQGSGLHRDIAEGILHCHLDLGQHEVAVSQTLKFLRGCRTMESQLSSLLFLIECYGKTNETIKEIIVLHRLINAHPYCDKFWKVLGVAYQKFFRPGVSVVTELDNIHFNYEPYREFLLTLNPEEQRNICRVCFARSKILKEIEPKAGKLSYLMKNCEQDFNDVSEEFLEIEKVLRKEIFNARKVEDDQLMENPAPVSSPRQEILTEGLIFHQKWLRLKLNKNLE